MEKLFFTLGVILCGLATGYVLQILTARGALRLPLDLTTLRKILQKIGILFCMSVSFMSALWAIRLDHVRLAALPLLCLLALALGGALALAYARLAGLSRQQAGSLFCCGSFSNLGAIGNLVCYSFLGEAGFALAAIYRIFEESFDYAVGFPVAKYFSSDERTTEPLGRRLARVFRDPFVAVALCALSVGILLNLSGIPRPVFMETVNAVLIPLGTFLLLVSIGLAMRIGSFGQYVKPCISVMAIKFLIIPAVLIALGLALGYDQIRDGLPLKVLIILSAMPVAFAALVPPSLYDLDLDLANACWFFTTLALVVVLPVQYLIVGLF